jgi:hypothetical protein
LLHVSMPMRAYLRFVSGNNGTISQASSLLISILIYGFASATMRLSAKLEVSSLRSLLSLLRSRHAPIYRIHPCRMVVCQDQGKNGGKGAKGWSSANGIHHLSCFHGRDHFECFVQAERVPKIIQRLRPLLDRQRNAQK